MQHANLIEFPNDLPRSADALLKKYILEQACFHPGGTPTFDKCVMAAATCIHEAIVNNAIPITDMPPSLYTALRDKTTEGVEQHCVEMKNKLITTLTSELSVLSEQEGVPPFVSLGDGTINRQQPHPWNGSFQRFPLQSAASYHEQCQAQQHMSNQIDHYLSGPLTQTKSLCIAGSPGCGKTYLMLLGAMYGLSKGLTVTTTALMAERALSLGGVHLHKLFHIPVNQHVTVQRLAEEAVVKILHESQIPWLLVPLGHSLHG